MKPKEDLLTQSIPDFNQIFRGIVKKKKSLKKTPSSRPLSAIQQQATGKYQKKEKAFLQTAV